MNKGQNTGRTHPLAAQAGRCTLSSECRVRRRCRSSLDDQFGPRPGCRGEGVSSDDESSESDGEAPEAPPDASSSSSTTTTSAAREGAEHPTVSVLCPTTFSRRAFHEILYASFSCQEYPGRLELVVYDSDGPRSPFFSKLRDPRVLYVHDCDRVGLGAKRNALVLKATGTYLCLFDDARLSGSTLG